LGPTAGNVFYFYSQVIDLCCWKFIDGEFEHLFGRNFQIAEIGLALASLFLAVVADLEIGHMSY